MLLPAAAPAQTHWGKLYGASQSLAIAEFAARSEALVVVIAASTSELLHLEAELSFFSQGRVPLHTFGDWETLTYDRVSPHQDIISQRIRTLYALPQQRRGLLLLTAPALMQRLPPATFLEQHALIISTGDQLPPDSFRERLVDAGYRHVAQVEEHGEFAFRGSILDLFPMSSNKPFRVEFFDEDIDTIRTFDPDTQRGLDKVTQIELLPAHEFPLNESGITLFRRQFRNTFEAESKNAPIYRDVSDGRAPAGIEYYTPLFFDEMAVLFDYLPDNATFLHVDGATEAMQSFWDATGERYEQRRHDIERPILEPAALYMQPDEVQEKLKQHVSITTQGFEIEKTGRHAVNFPTAAGGLYPIEPRGERPMGALQDFIGGFDGRVLFVAESTGRREVLLDQLVGNRLTPETVDGWQSFLASERDLCLTTAPLDRGVHLPDAKIALITEAQLGATRVTRRERRRPTRDSDAIIANLTDLNIGAPVVHIDHGVGRYHGLTTPDHPLRR